MCVNGKRKATPKRGIKESKKWKWVKTYLSSQEWESVEKYNFPRRKADLCVCLLGQCHRGGHHLWTIKNRKWYFLWWRPMASHTLRGDLCQDSLFGCMNGDPVKQSEHSFLFNTIRMWSKTHCMASVANIAIVDQYIVRLCMCVCVCVCMCVCSMVLPFINATNFEASILASKGKPISITTRQDVHTSHCISGYRHKLSPKRNRENSIK